VAAGPGQCDEACTVRGHRARSASGSATAGGSPVAPARCGLRREHRREMGSSPGKVREATTHHSGVSMARRRCSEATALRWTATTRDGSCSFKGDEAGWNRRMGGRRWGSLKGGGGVGGSDGSKPDVGSDAPTVGVDKMSPTSREGGSNSVWGRSHAEWRRAMEGARTMIWP
jgi:hypothetical protein